MNGALVGALLGMAVWALITAFGILADGEGNTFNRHWVTVLLVLCLIGALLGK